MIKYNKIDNINYINNNKYNYKIYYFYKMSNIINYTICCKNVIIVMIIISIIIGIYHIILYNRYGKYLIYHDISNKKIKIPLININISGWTISHFIFYFILWFIFPKCIYIIIIIGILWKFIENLLGYYNNNIDLQHKITRKYNKIEYNNWWSGSFRDIIVNIIGVYIGFNIYNILNNIWYYI